MPGNPLKQALSRDFPMQAGKRREVPGKLLPGARAGTLPQSTTTNHKIAVLSLN